MLYFCTFMYMYSIFFPTFSKFLKSIPNSVRMIDSNILDSRWVNMYSVDMIPPGYTFENFNWFTNQDIVGCELLSKVCSRFKTFIDNHVTKSRHIEIDEDKYAELECDLLKQVFIKKHIFFVCVCCKFYYKSLLTAYLPRYPS